jgi:hypothetical protein
MTRWQNASMHQRFDFVFRLISKTNNNLHLTFD